MKIGLLFISFVFLIATIPVIDINPLVGTMNLMVSIIAFIGFLFAFIQDYKLAKEYPNLCGKRKYLFGRGR